VGAALTVATIITEGWVAAGGLDLLVPPQNKNNRLLKYNIKSFYLHNPKGKVPRAVPVGIYSDERLGQHEALQLVGARADNNITQFVDNAVIRWEIIAAYIRID
jgi:hypothetical protein